MLLPQEEWLFVHSQAFELSGESLNLFLYEGVGGRWLLPSMWFSCGIVDVITDAGCSEIIPSGNLEGFDSGCHFSQAGRYSGESLSLGNMVIGGEWILELVWLR